MIAEIPQNDTHILESVKSISYPYDNYQSTRMNNRNVGYFASDYCAATPIRFNFVNDPYQQVVSRINKLKMLNNDWDGYDSVKVTEKSAQNALMFIQSLSISNIESVTDIFPNPHGTISMEWVNGLNEKISLEIGGNSFSYFITNLNHSPKLVDGKDIFSNIDEITTEINHHFRKKIS